jgi:hypothetical protein
MYFNKRLMPLMSMPHSTNDVLLLQPVGDDCSEHMISNHAMHMPRHLPGVTVTVSCWDADVAPSLSVEVTLHVLMPELPAAGVKLSSPAELSCGRTLNIA